MGSNETTTVNLAPGQLQNYALTWDPPTTNYQGYLVQATLTDVNGHVLDTSYTAVDVSSSWAKFPRYGFVTNYGDNYLQTLMTNRLNLYHLDGVQFYDWEWKHHVPLAGTVSSPATSWVDIGEDTNYMHSVQTLISDVHANSAVAMDYNLIYGAWAGYGSDGSGVNYQWGLWWNNNCTNQVNIALTGARDEQPVRLRPREHLLAELYLRPGERRQRCLRFRWLAGRPVGQPGYDLHLRRHCGDPVERVQQFPDQRIEHCRR